MLMVDSLGWIEREGNLKVLAAMTKWMVRYELRHGDIASRRTAGAEGGGNLRWRWSLGIPSQEREVLQIENVKSVFQLKAMMH